jgi:molybdopterin converting factor small subunit
VRVRLFAALRELAGSSWIEAAAVADVAALRRDLETRFGPRFEAIVAAGTVVVNGEPAGAGTALAPDDEVALLPPVSGG